jgi:hypothetical protein
MNPVCVIDAGESRDSPALLRSLFVNSEGAQLR